MGETRPDAVREVWGYLGQNLAVAPQRGGQSFGECIDEVRGAFRAYFAMKYNMIDATSESYTAYAFDFALSRMTPTGPRVTGQTYLSDLRVYLGVPTS